MGAQCWLCDGRGQSQIVLRPDGKADGRKVCRVCVRRLFVWLGAIAPDGRAQALAPAWLGLASPEPGVDAEVAAVREAVCSPVRAALPELDAAGRLDVATSLWDLDLRERAFEALALVAPDDAAAALDRRLTSLLSRLLHPAALSPQAREVLERAIYPGPAR